MSEDSIFRVTPSTTTYFNNDDITLKLTGGPMTVYLGSVSPGIQVPDWRSYGNFTDDRQVTVPNPGIPGFYVIGAKRANDPDITTFATIKVQNGPAEFLVKNAILIAAGAGILVSATALVINFAFRPRRKIFPPTH